MAENSHTPEKTERTPFARPRASVLGGVSVALADHLEWPVILVRCAFVAATLLSGAGILFYAWLWALAPVRSSANEEDQIPVTHRINPVPVFLGTGILAGLVAIVQIASNTVSATAAIVVSIVAMVGAVTWSEFVNPEASSLGRVSPASLRIGSGMFLVGLAVMLGTFRPKNTTLELWFAVVGAAFAGALVSFGPWILNLWRELLTERTARIREEQRAEIAAHLHDSVLQTLALIQNRAGASSEVGRLARAQERELREWLYAQAGPSIVTGGADLVGQIEAFALALEVDHAAHFDVVSVGGSLVAPPPELTAAVREAMLNAARHAGGDISVYIEKVDDVVHVYVRDRGPGFDLDSIPEGRLGVRESIMGRMRRIDGQATVNSQIVGTEIHLSVTIVSQHDDER